MTDEPKRKAAEGSIHAEFSLSQRAIPPGKPGTIWAMLKLTAARPRGAEGKGRLPLNLGLVLDRSGSMEGDPLAYVKMAACRIVEQMGAGDRFSLVIFDHEVEVVCPARAVAEKDALKAAIAGIQARGSTNLSGGLLRGYQEVKSGAKSGQVNRILLLTDGCANQGITDRALLAAKVRSMREHGIAVSAVGVGRHFDEDLLLALAEAGGGNYYYLKDPDEIPGVLARELQGLLSVVAQAVRVTAMGGENCRVTAVLGYEPVFCPGEAIIDLPDLYEHETKLLLLEIAHPALPAGEHEVVRVNLAYVDALNSLNAVNLSIAARLTAAEGPPAGYQPDFEIVKAVELTRTALTKDETIAAMDQGDLDAGRRRLEERIEALEKLSAAAPAPDAEIAGEIEELRNLVRRMEDLEEGGQEGMACREPELRKELRFQSYQRRRNRR
ncbi:MAG: VWA domain-containing protein [Firmicutes bacterium]|nr:VWA domain-containing protein [Bacillota bacterium]